MCKPNISQRGFHQLSRDTKLDVSYRYLIPVTEKQPEGNSDALYALKSRGFGGEAGLATLNYNMPVVVVRDNTQLCTYFFSPFTPTY